MTKNVSEKPEATKRVQKSKSQKSKKVSVQSLKKVPYVYHSVLQAVKKSDPNPNKPLVVYKRSCTIIPAFIGYTFHIHTGKSFIKITISESHIGLKFGELAPTRKHTKRK